MNVLERVWRRPALREGRDISPTAYKKYLGSAVLLVFWGAFSWMALTYVHDYYSSSRLAFVFDSDGPREVSRSLEMFNAGEYWSTENFIYGNAHNFLTQVVLRIIGVAGYSPDFLQVAYVMAAVQLMSYLALIFGVRSLGKMLTGSDLIASSTALYVATVPSVFYWAFHIHPDVLQLALITGSLVFLYRKPSPRNLLVAGILLGMAIGTKYLSGIYIVPLFAATIAKVPSSEKEAAGAIPQRVGMAALGGFLGFAVTNLTVFTHFGTFIRQLSAVGREMSVGDGYVADPNPLLWLPVIGTQLGLLLALIAAGLVYTLARGKWSLIEINKFSSHRAFVTLSILLALNLGLGHLLLSVNHRVPRYMLHLLPAVVVVFYAVAYLALTERKKIASIISSITSVFIIAFASHALFSGFATLSAMPDGVETNPRVKAGRFVESSCDLSASVLAPMYSYVPPVFENLVAERRYFFNDEDLNSADLLLLNDSVPGRHVWPDTEGLLKKGDLVGSDAQFELFANRVFSSNEFSLLLDLGGAKVYLKQGSDICSPPSHELEELNF